MVRAPVSSWWWQVSQGTAMSGPGRLSPGSTRGGLTKAQPQAGALGHHCRGLYGNLDVLVCSITRTGAAKICLLGGWSLKLAPMPVR